MSYKLLEYEGYTFRVFNNVYEPAEDTFLLADNLDSRSDDVVLDMGTGCGILAVLIASNARRVVAVDVNPHAVRCARVNGGINEVSKKINVIQGDLFEPIKEDEIFNLILFNAPYLPVKENERTEWIDYAWVGGEKGRTIIDRFILSAPRYLKTDGRILLVQSTLSDVDETLEKLNSQGLNTSIVGQTKVAFETITLIRAGKQRN